MVVGVWAKNAGLFLVGAKIRHKSLHLDGLMEIDFHYKQTFFPQNFSGGKCPL